MLILRLFVGGVMSLVWIAWLTLFVDIEKPALFDPTLSKAESVLFIAGGA